MPGDVKSLLLPPTGLLCVACGRLVSGCGCNESGEAYARMAASVDWSRRGSYIEGLS
jgi:hypothetical protein